MWRSWFSVSFCLLAAECCWGQADSVVSVDRQLSDVEVVAARIGDRYSSAVPMQTMSDKTMSEMGVQGMTDALKHVAGITVRDYGGAGGMKTVSVRGMGARHTAVLYDGFVQGDSQNGEVDVSRFSLSQVETLSLTIGDGDDIWQPARLAATAATLSIGTLMPPAARTSPMVRVRTVVGSWGLVNPSFYYGQNLSTRFSVVGQGEVFHADNGYPFRLKNVALTTREHRRNSRMDSGRGEIGLAWHGEGDRQLRLKVYYDDSHRRLPGIVHYYTSVNDESLADKKMSAQLLYSGHLARQWAMKVGAQYCNMLTDYKNNTPGSAVHGASYHQREAYATVALLYEPFHWLSTSLSADAFRNALHGPGSVRKPVRNSVLGAYAVRVHTDRTQLVARVVGAWHQDQGDGDHHDEKRWSPSVSISHRPIVGLPLTVRAMYKEIFRMPTFGECYFYHLGSRTLSPEKTRQWNVGFTWQGEKRGILKAGMTADVFLSQVEDKIVAIPFNTFVWRMMNLAKVRSHGIDVTTEMEWSFAQYHRLMARGNYSWQAVRNKTDARSVAYGQQVAYMPEHSWCMTLTWMNPWVSMALTTNGLSERWTTNEHSAGTRMAGYAECDLALWHTFQISKVELTCRAAMLNLLDHQYDIVAHYPMPGRSWRLELTVKI